VVEKNVAGLLVVDLELILAQAQGQLSCQAIHLALKGQCREIFKSGFFMIQLT